MIEIRDLCRSYGANQVLRNVELTFGAGELVALLGPNGAGKSTLMRCILGMTSYEGQISVDGLDPLRQGKALRSRIGYMPQGVSLHHDLSVLETMRFYAEVVGSDGERILKLLGDVGLEQCTDRRVGELSGGMQQRLSFAIARLRNPSVLLLDEPSSGLDRSTKTFMLSALSELVQGGMAVLFATHLTEDVARVAHRFVMLNDGRLFETERDVVMRMSEGMLARTGAEA